MDIVNIVLEIAKINKYSLLFVIYLIEGPVAGFVSAMVAVAGDLNIWIVFALLIIAEIIADVFFYYLGRGMSNGKLSKRLKGIDNEFLNELNRVTKKSFFKVILVLKVTSIIAIPGLIYLGNIKVVKDKKFLLYTSLICLVKDATILALGYCMGLELNRFLEIYNVYKIVGIILLSTTIIYLIIKIYRHQIRNAVTNIIKNKI